MLLLGIDIETDGVEDLNLSVVTEIGAVLCEASDFEPVKMFSELVNEVGRKMLPETAELTGITDGMLKDYGLLVTDERFSELGTMFEMADCVVAQNGLKFDKPRLERFFERVGMVMPDKTWIDMLYDVPFPKACKYKNLMYLCAFHGFINPFPHRAVTDVLSMLKILKCYNVEKMMEVAQTPLITIRAKVSYDDRQKAKDEGFYWNPKKKSWLLSGREKVLQDRPFTFDIEVVNGK